MRTARCPSECTIRCRERKRSSFPSRQTAYPCSSAASPRRTRPTWATRRRTSRSMSSRGSSGTRDTMCSTCRTSRTSRTGREWKDIVNQYFGEYLEVMEALRCNSVDVYAFATDYIDDIIAQIQGLVQKKHAYVAEDGSVYYDTTTFSGWGKLSGQKVEALRPGARITIEERKRHPADFVLWRAQKPSEPAWDSPWGKGRPGWHIEDTAITIRHFGPQYDLHGGATELLFPHPEAEIAQAEAYTVVTPFVKYWIHGGMVTVKGEEMHKSLGNYWPVKAALKLYEPEVIRFFLINVQYRGPIDFAPELLDEAKRSYERLRETTRTLEAERRSGRSGSP